MIAKKSIPVNTTLADAFGSLEVSLTHADRWNNLAEQLERRFRRKPAYVATRESTGTPQVSVNQVSKYPLVTQQHA